MCLPAPVALTLARPQSAGLSSDQAPWWRWGWGSQSTSLRVESRPWGCPRGHAHCAEAVTGCCSFFGIFRGQEGNTSSSSHRWLSRRPTEAALHSREIAVMGKSSPGPQGCSLQGGDRTSREGPSGSPGCQDPWARRGGSRAGRDRFHLEGGFLSSCYRPHSRLLLFIFFF